jgi:hypothetical protein
MKAQKSANIDSDHISHTRCHKIESQDMQSKHDIRKTTIKALRGQMTEVRRSRNELESKFQSAHDGQTSSVNELWYGTEEKIKKVAATTVGYAQKQEKKEWFDEPS